MTIATPAKKTAAEKSAAPEIKYQGSVHELQKQLMTKYYADLTSIANGGPGRSAQLLIAGNPVEVLRTFDMIPVYPEINALQMAIRHQSLDPILAPYRMAQDVACTKTGPIHYDALPMRLSAGL